MGRLWGKAASDATLGRGLCREEAPGPRVTEGISSLDPCPILPLLVFPKAMKCDSAFLGFAVWGPWTKCFQLIWSYKWPSHVSRSSSVGYHLGITESAGNKVICFSRHFLLSSLFLFSSRLILLPWPRLMGRSTIVITGGSHMGPVPRDSSWKPTSWNCALCAFVLFSPLVLPDFCFWFQRQVLEMSVGQDRHTPPEGLTLNRYQVNQLCFCLHFQWGM